MFGHIGVELGKQNPPGDEFGKGPKGKQEKLLNFY